MFRTNGSFCPAQPPGSRSPAPTATGQMAQAQPLPNSGHRSGKTLAAILASRLIDARLTIIVAVNNTLVGWEEEILNAFPMSKVILKSKGNISVDNALPTYVVLNFEAFQQPGSSNMVRALAEQNKIDFIVLDEIHSVKQRAFAETKRRQVIGGLLSLASERNPDLRVLGMSATPVVNNLKEAVSLIEMVSGTTYPDLETGATIANAVAVHEKLVVLGVRYKPRYDLQVRTVYKELSGDDIVDKLGSVKKGDVLGIEQILTSAKLNYIVDSSRPGTIVFTIYVEGIVEILRAALEAAGFRVGVFTGDNKTGLKSFVQKKVDVLIGSSTLGTGVDGLQHVCNRLVIATLPWTSAGYEQLLGRIYRQGSKFETVDVIIPQVVLDHEGDRWSWDIQRKHRIEFKRSLADATVDGSIPDGVLESPEQMFLQARKALHGWIDRLERGDVVQAIPQSKLEIPLLEDLKSDSIRRLGDFSRLNSR